MDVVCIYILKKIFFFFSPPVSFVCAVIKTASLVTGGMLITKVRLMDEDDEVRDRPVWLLPLLFFQPLPMLIYVWRSDHTSVHHELATT